jgi:hypothetical protein
MCRANKGKGESERKRPGRQGPQRGRVGEDDGMRRIWIRKVVLGNRRGNVQEAGKQS